MKVEPLRVSVEASVNRRLRLKSVVALILAVLVIVASVPLLQAVSEAPTIEWNKTYSDVQANSVIQTADGGYAIVGASAPTVVTIPNSGFSTYSLDYSDQKAVLVKTNSAGELEWKKSYGTEVFGYSRDAVSVVQTMDSGYMLFGRGGYFVKTDAEGNVEWSRNLGLNVNAAWTVSVEAGIQTSDGNYVLVGNTKETNGENVAWLIKANEQGEILWNQTFTGGFSALAVIETNDRGCAIAGSWRNDFWFAKIDSNSNLQWSQTYAYGEPSDTHSALSIAKTKDGGYVLAGTGMWQASGGNVPWLIKINSQGHTQWSLPYGHIPIDGFSSVVQTDDEGYMVTLSNNPVLIRMDSSGSEQWSMTYADVSSSLPPFSVFPLYNAASLIRTSDGGYATVGTAFGDV
jgi:hypothetical protein